MNDSLRNAGTFAHLGRWRASRIAECSTTVPAGGRSRRVADNLIRTTSRSPTAPTALPIRSNNSTIPRHAAGAHHSNAVYLALEWWRVPLCRVKTHPAAHLAPFLATARSIRQQRAGILGRDTPGHQQPPTRRPQPTRPAHRQPRLRISLRKRSPRPDHAHPRTHRRRPATSVQHTQIPKPTHNHAGTPYIGQLNKQMGVFGGRMGTSCFRESTTQHSLLTYTRLMCSIRAHLREEPRLPNWSRY